MTTPAERAASQELRDRAAAEMLAELIQIAAMAERIAEDCGLIEPTYDDPTHRVSALFIHKLTAAADKGAQP